MDFHYSDFSAALPVDSSHSPAGYHSHRPPLSQSPSLPARNPNHPPDWLVDYRRRGMVEFEVGIGALGSAGVPLNARTEGKVSDRKEGMTRLCDACGEQDLIESG